MKTGVIDVGGGLRGIYAADAVATKPAYISVYGLFS